MILQYFFIIILFQTYIYWEGGHWLRSCFAGTMVMCIFQMIPGELVPGSAAGTIMVLLSRKTLHHCIMFDHSSES